MKFEKLTTDRLILRILSPEVYDFIYQNFSEEEQMKFLGLSSKEELAKEKNKHDNGLSMFNKSFRGFQLIEKVSDRIIGWCGYHTWYTEHSRAEIGYHISIESFKQKGLMSEALEKILEYGFITMNLHRIEALVAVYNIPSLKLLSKMNFKKEGILREHYLVNDRLEDSVIYSLLKSEFRK
ncbi:MAG: GNAT family N-acetyltransferase [Saprospiraceae bacterium]